MAAATPLHDGAASTAAGNTDTFEIARASIARIMVMAGTQIVSRGTGTLVTPNLVLSALHVVANRRAEPPQAYPGEMTLEFPGFKTKGKIVDGAWDPKADWVLIECAEAPPITPMPMAAMKENKRDWESYGFPEANWRDGLLLTGTVTRCDGELEGVRAHQLDCTQAAGGRGLKVKGLSGAPVVVGGMLVGVMRFALMEEERTEGGILYACPVSAVKERWPMLDVPPLPKKRVPQRMTAQIMAATAARAGWEIGALAGSLAVIAIGVFALSQFRVPSVEVNAEVTTGDVQFSLADSGRVLLASTNGGMLGVDSVTAAGMEYFTVPGTRGAARARIDSQSVEFQSGAGGANAGQLMIDLDRPLTAGTRVWLHHTDGRHYRLAFDSLNAPLRLQYGGTVRLTAGSGAPAALNAALDDVMLFPSGSDRLTTEFALAPGAPVKLLSAPRVRRLQFFDRPPREGARPALESTISNGVIHLGGSSSDTVALRDKDSLVVVGDPLTVDHIDFSVDRSALSVHFSGRVTELSVGSAGGPQRNRMPTWLDRFRHGYPLQSGIAAAALAALMAYLIVRWRRRVV